MKKFNKNPGIFKATIGTKFPQIISLYYSLAYHKRRKTLRQLSIKQVFTEIASDGGWGNSESLSGPGSTFTATHEVRTKMRLLLKEFQVKTLLDIPCGDFNWIEEVALEMEKYIGADIVDDLIMRNRKRFASRVDRQDRLNFLVLDITKDKLPVVDLILCRDCLGHFSTSNINRAIKNIKNNAKYFLTTTHPSCKRNIDIVTGEWRPINLELAPFNFPAPLRLIGECNEDEKQPYSDKSLGLWEVKDINF